MDYRAVVVLPRMGSIGTAGLEINFLVYWSIVQCFQILT